jgi:hypothetical protein
LVLSSCRSAYQFHKGILVVVPLGLLLARLLRAARRHAHPRVVVHTGHTAVPGKSCAPIAIKGMVCAVVNRIASRAMFSPIASTNPLARGNDASGAYKAVTIPLHLCRLHMSASRKASPVHHTLRYQTWQNSTGCKLSTQLDLNSASRLVPPACHPLPCASQ